MFFNIYKSGHWSDLNKLIQILTQHRVHWEGPILQSDNFLIFVGTAGGITGICEIGSIAKSNKTTESQNNLGCKDPILAAM